MTWKDKIHNLANPECDDCGGEGLCDYARGEDSFTDVCDTCFPNGMPDLEADEYDIWRDDHL